MKKILKTITVTGVDDNTELDDLVEISNKYSFVEFGILLSASSTGNNRFPSYMWLRKLSEIKNLNLSGHLCGRIVRDLLRYGTWPSQYDFLPVQRWQINTHGMKHKFNLELLEKAVKQQNDLGREIIFQYDLLNPEIFYHCTKLGLNVSALFDLSGGNGILPNEWPNILEYECGYAGGLSPDNIYKNLELIEQKIPDGRSTWIDAETWLRSDNDRVFDFDKVTQFINNAINYVK